MQTANPSDIKEKLETVLRLLEELCNSDYWAYTREFDLGKLDGARTLVKDVLTDEFPT